MKRRATAVVLAVLLVASTIPFGPLGPATAASTQSQTFIDSAELYVIDVSNFSGSFTLQVDAHEPTPSGSTTTVYLDEFADTDANADGNIVFANYGAYSNLTVEVIPASSASGSVSINSSGDLFTHRDRVASTGGDSDYACELGGQLASVTNPDVHQIDCNPLPGTTADHGDTDGQQSGLDIYQGGQNIKAGNDNLHTYMNNNLQDTKTQALIHGKNAYIRALNNGSSEAAATTAAKDAVRNYYTRHMKAAFNEYNIAVMDSVYHDKVDENDSTTANIMVGQSNDYDLNGSSVSSYTAPNGESLQYKLIGWDSSTSHYYIDLMDRANDTLGESTAAIHYNEDTNSLVEVTNVTDFRQQIHEIEAQNADAEAQIDTLVNNTYSEYQSGDINNSDLIDPYVLQSEHSPGTSHQGWAAAQLTLLGTNSPDAFDQIGEFNVTYADGTTESGVLFSQENPASGSFEVNTTYDPSQVGGTQYIVTANETHEITQNFTIDSITTHDGTERQNVTIVEKTYTTTNTTELKQLYDELAYLRSQIEAREKNLQTSGGGGAFFDGNSSMLIAGVVVVAGVALLVGRKEGGNDY